MFTDGPLGTVILLVLVLAEAGGIAMLYVAAKADRFAGFWQRNYVQMRMQDPSLTPVAFARQAIPLTIFVVTVIGALLLFAASGPEAPLWVMLAALGLIVVAGVLLLVVTRTGRPRGLVLRPFRDTGHEQAAVLLRATYVYEVAVGDSPEFAIQAAALAGDQAEALRLLRSVGVSRTELSMWTKPSRVVTVGHPDYLESAVVAWRRPGETHWIDWSAQVPREAL